jgi:hypothetical protein
VSAVDPDILAALELTTPTGQLDIITPSTGAAAVSFDTYDVRIAILAARPEDLHFISETLQVISSPLRHQGFDVLLGTDVLSKCIFHYNGADNHFSIAY